MILEVFKEGFLSSWGAMMDMVPFLLPISLVMIAWRIWRYYIVRDFISKIDWILLEVRLPKEHQKTPQAMEVVLGALYQFPTPPTWYDYWWVGKVPTWSSLELVSINGHVHFFIRIPKGQKSILENHIYSQYPEAEVHQVPDYVGGVNFDVDKPEWSLFGMEHVLVRDDAYPIKTYVDYGLDRELLKEEQKVDPITSAIEFLGSVGEGEQVWIQIMIMAAQPRFLKSGTWFEREDWKGNAKGLLAKLMKRDVPNFSPAMLSPGEKSVVEAIEKSLNKIGFDCGIRTIYLAKKDKFNAGNIASLFASFRQYNTQNLNSFKPTRITNLDWWKDLLGFRVPRLKRELFQAYVNRGYFYSPFVYSPIFVLNSEELATIYHFPGAVAVTPTFGRIESKRAEAPVNLPI